MTEADLINALDTGAFASTVMTITPAFAAQLLERNPDNRKIRVSKLAQYASDIENGRWQLNGEPIIFSDDGKLNDGQHRLAAIVRSGTAIETLVVVGVGRETRTTLDTGANRAAGDHLGIMGISHANETARTARLVLSFRANNGRNFTNSQRISSAEIIGIINDEPAIHEAVIAAYAVPREIAPCRLSIAAFLGYMAAGNANKSAFYEQVLKGEGISAADPAYSVRARMQRPDTSRANEQVETYLRGQNAFLRGENNFRIRLIGEFPAIGA